MVTTTLRSKSPFAGLPRPSFQLLVAVSLCLFSGVTMARADCQQDIGALMKKREAAVAVVNGSKAKNGKLDPMLACPRLRNLGAIEKEAVAYFQKNKEWCNLPDDLVSKMTSSSQRTTQFAAQACAFAVKAKQMQQQAQQQQQDALPKLPTGPL